MIYTKFRRMPLLFEPKYVHKVKKFKLEYTMAGGMQSILDELVCYYMCYDRKIKPMRWRLRSDTS